MRIRTGHRPQDWQDIGEGYAGSIPLRGSLVVGASFGVTRKIDAVAQIKARLATGEPSPEPRQYANRARFYASDEERLEARRRTFRDAKKRARERRSAA